MRLKRSERPPLTKVDPGPVLIMLHGLGSNEEDLMGLASQLDPRLQLISLRAPIEYGPGYSWFDIAWDGGTITFDEEQARRSLELLIDEIDSLVVERRHLFVGGFSQGAAMTTAILAQRPDLAGALVLSGRMSPDLRLPDLKNAPVLIQHGLYDNVIPVENGRLISKAMEEAGAETLYREYPMGHEVSLQSLADLSTWLTRKIEATISL